ncbi:MAG: glycosyltransferase [Chitinophagales bacterium]|nr:glycosyltransferase [Chitinophagales bacterium]
MKSILYILYDGLTESLAQSQVLSYLKFLTTEGFQFTVISCEKQDKYHKSGEDIRKVCKEHSIDWHPLIYHKTPPILSTLFDINRMKRKAEALFQEKKFDAVHCRSYIAAFVGSHLKSKYNCKFIFDIRGFFADERVDGDIWKLENPVYNAVYNFFKKKEAIWFNEADYTVSLTYNAAKHIRKSYPAANISVIPCCVNTADFNYLEFPPNLKSNIRNSLGLSEDAFVLMYHGSIGTWYLLQEMMGFFKIVKSKIPNSKFFFLSKEEVGYIHEEAMSQGLDIEDIIVKSVPFDSVPKYLSIADASVFFIKPVFSKQASSPTKLAELLSMGIPVFTNSGVGDVDSIIEESGFGYLIKKFEESHYNQAVEKFLGSKRFDKENMHRYTVENFDSSIGADRYREIYKALLSTPKHELITG